jgi:hypothetical protein
MGHETDLNRWYFLLLLLLILLLLLLFVGPAEIPPNALQPSRPFVLLTLP